MAEKEGIKERLFSIPLRVNLHEEGAFFKDLPAVLSPAQPAFSAVVFRSGRISTLGGPSGKQRVQLSLPSDEGEEIVLELTVSKAGSDKGTLQVEGWDKRAKKPLDPEAITLTDREGREIEAVKSRAEAFGEEGTGEGKKGAIVIFRSLPEGSFFLTVRRGDQIWRMEVNIEAG